MVLYFLFFVLLNKNSNNPLKTTSMMKLNPRAYRQGLHLLIPDIEHYTLSLIHEEIFVDILSKKLQV